MISSNSERTAALLNEIPFGAWMTRPVLNGTPGASGLRALQIGSMLAHLRNQSEIEQRWNADSRCNEYRRKEKR